MRDQVPRDRPNAGRGHAQYRDGLDGRWFSTYEHVERRVGFVLNAAFPAWALIAISSAALIALTPIGGALGDDDLDGQAVTIAAGAAAIGAALAAGQRALARRL